MEEVIKYLCQFFFVFFVDNQVCIVLSTPYYHISAICHIFAGMCSSSQNKGLKIKMLMPHSKKDLKMQDKCH